MSEQWKPWPDSPDTEEVERQVGVFPNVLNTPFVVETARIIIAEALTDETSPVTHRAAWALLLARKIAAAHQPLTDRDPRVVLADRSSSDAERQRATAALQGQQS